MTTRAIVANPGSIPELANMANSLASAGLLRAYVAPFSPTRAELDRSALRRMGRPGSAAVSQLGRRVVSEPVATTDRYQKARARELAAVAGVRLRLPLPIQRSLFAWRNQAIDEATARLLRAGDTDLIVALSAASAALRQARRLGVRSWLDCPIAHHGYSARLLSEELRLQPDFAPTMQLVASGPAEAWRLDEEVALADRLLVLSTFQARTFAEAGVPFERLHITPLGVDTSLFRPLERIRGEPFTVGFVGQVTQRKGVSYLISAFEALQPQEARLLIVGRPVGPAQVWQREGVEHHQAVARWELPTFYARMDVFVLPSLIEGFGLTALEAMSSGVPVIVSENTFGTDIIIDGQNGYVVPIRDVDAIVDRVRSLAEDEALRLRMGQEARKTAEQYSWDAFGRRVVALLGRP